jgi:hypothetical protein
MARSRRGGQSLSDLTYILILFPSPVFQEWLEVGGVDTLSQNLTYVKTLVELLSTDSRQMGVQVTKKISFYLRGMTWYCAFQYDINCRSMVSSWF